MDRAIWNKRIILRAMKKELDSRGTRVRMRTLTICVDSELSHFSGSKLIFNLKKRRQNVAEIFKKRKIKNVSKKEATKHTHSLYTGRRFEEKWGRFRFLVDNLERSIKSPRSKIGRVSWGNFFLDRNYIWTFAGPITVTPKMLGWPKRPNSTVTTREILLVKTLNAIPKNSILLDTERGGLVIVPKSVSSPVRFSAKFNVIRSDLAHAEKKSIEKKLRSMHVKPDVLQKILDDFRLDFGDPIDLLPEDFKQSYHGIPLFLDFRIRQFCKENFVSEVRKKAFADITAGYREILENRPDLRRSETWGDYTIQGMHSKRFLLPWEVEDIVKLARCQIRTVDFNRVFENAVGKNILTPSVIFNWLAELYYAGRWEEVTRVHFHPRAGLNAKASLIGKYQDLAYRDIFGDTDSIPEAIRLRVSPDKVMKRFLARTTQFQRSEFVGDTSLFSGSDHGYTQKDYDKIEEWLKENQDTLGQVTLIRTLGRLAEESMEMGHCVWDYASQIDAMETVVFHIGGGPLKEGTTYGWSKVGKRTVHHNGLVDRRPYSREEEVAIKIQEFLMRFMG